MVVAWESVVCAVGRLHVSCFLVLFVCTVFEAGYCECGSKAV